MILQEMREAFESESRATGKDRLLITMAVPASLEYAGKVGTMIMDKLNLGQKHILTIMERMFLSLS